MLLNVTLWYKNMMKRKCCICGEKGNIYLPINPCFREEQKKYGYVSGKLEMLNEKKYVCKNCGATDRDRICADFLGRILGNENLALNVLDIAPSSAIKRFFSERYPFAVYKTADLYMKDVDYCLDIQNMEKIEDGKFDITICCHVLEHVKDDKKALKEFYRILSDRGLGIFLVPIDLEQEEIDEEYGCSPEENIRRFGQEDHVRKYSKTGFVDRLSEAGFKVCQLGYKWFGRKDSWDNAFTKTSVLYVVSKYEGYTESNLEQMFKNDLPRVEVTKGNNEIEYNIDGLEKQNGFISIWGWMFHKNKKDQNSAGIVILKRNDVDYYRKRFLLKERSDVQKAYGKEYLRTGIEIMIPINDLVKGNYEVSLLLTCDSVAYEIGWKQNVEV